MTKRPVLQEDITTLIFMRLTVSKHVRQKLTELQVELRESTIVGDFNTPLRF